MDETISGITVAVYIVGIMQFIKKLLEGDPENPEGKELSYKATQLLSLGVSIIVLVIATLLNGEYLAPGASQVIKEIFSVIGGILAVPGLYSVASDKVLPALRR